MSGPAPQGFWNAPLVHVGLALTCGIVLDRWLSISLHVSLLAGLAAVGGWLLSSRRRPPFPALLYLWASIAALGAAYHHRSRDFTPADDICLLADEEPRLAWVRGVVQTQPVIAPEVPADSLRSFPRPIHTRWVLRASHIKQGYDWLPVSGQVQVSVQDKVVLHAGDSVEIVGKLAAPQGPANPGEFDYAAFLRDQGIRAVLSVHKTAEGVVVMESGRSWSITGSLARLRGWGVDILEQALPARHAPLASALLLGETSGMTAADWDKFLRSGVIHVLAISGQHLVVLAAFLWLWLRLLGMRRRRGAVVVALILLGYALLTGGRPPVMRSAWMMLAWCGAMLLQRPPFNANTFALAWILVALGNPTDIFHAGCQLSFLAVAVLAWGAAALQPDTDDPLQRLVEEARPIWADALFKLGRCVFWAYAFNLAVWLAVTPLVAARYHLVSPVALLIGPPMVLLSSVALLCGFGLLLTAPLVWPLGLLFARLISGSLGLAGMLVDISLNLPGSYRYVPDVPPWWLWGLYLGLTLALSWRSLLKTHLWLASGLAWVAVLLVTWSWAGPREFRCTFLAVGHGSAIAIETPDGRTLLYDAGAITGPDVTRRIIAPFLWNRGITRIDEVFLSHADLDHFNGIPDLAEHFRIGQVTCTPTFAERTTPGVALTLRALEKHGLPVRTIKAGDQFEADGIHMKVLHPPARGPEGNENARSMVLLLEYAGLEVLLTGDLEGSGLDRVLSLPAPAKIDVLLAPHHGSRTANTPEFAAWARPRFVVSCQGFPRSLAKSNPYEELGARYLATWVHGAVTIRKHAGAWTVETHRTRFRWPIPATARERR